LPTRGDRGVRQGGGGGGEEARQAGNVECVPRLHNKEQTPFGVAARRGANKYTRKARVLRLLALACACLRLAAAPSAPPAATAELCRLQRSRHNRLLGAKNSRAHVEVCTNEGPGSNRNVEKDALKTLILM